MNEHAATYRRAHERIVELVSESDADVGVPTLPRWSVKDTIAHLAVSLAAYASGDMEGAGAPTWGDRQVEQRRDRALSEVLSEWDENLASGGAAFESRLAPVAAADVLAHEQDIRTALE